MLSILLIIMLMYMYIDMPAHTYVVVHSLALYVILYVLGQVKRSRAKKGPGKTVKSGFRAGSSGQDRFQAVKNLDPGRGRSYGKYWSDRPLL